MGLKYGDLKDTVIKKISIDQYEPKTGNSEDTVVVAFQTPEEAVGKDLHDFLNNGSEYIKDVDVSPNMNEDDYYMVFVELDRNEDLVNRVCEMLRDVENLTGVLKWEGVTHIHETPFPVDTSLGNYVATDPELYQTRDQWEEEQLNASKEYNNNVMEFFANSSLQNVQLEENNLTMSYYDTDATLEIVGFGTKEVMSDIGIAESALQPLDSQMRSFNKMLGEMRAVKIDEYVVIFDPSKDQVLVAKSC